MLNAARLALLATELKKPIYTNEQDIEVALMLAKKGSTQGNKLTRTADLLDALIVSGIYKTLKQKAATDADVGVILDALLNPNIGSEIDLNRPAAVGMIAAMEAKGIITAIQKSEIEALGKADLSIAEELLGQGVTVHHLDVAHAKGGI